MHPISTRMAATASKTGAERIPAGLAPERTTTAQSGLEVEPWIRDIAGILSARVRSGRVNHVPTRTQSERGNPLIVPLTGIASRLTYIRATAVTVELALRAQNGDQDVDIAACMRTGVCDALDGQYTQLVAIIESLGGSPPVRSS